MTKHSNLIGFAFGFFILICLQSCKDETVYLPKPRTYPKVEFPERNYQGFKMNECDFTFEYPDYAEIEKDEAFFEVDLTNECWFDVEFAPFNGSLHCSYHTITSRKAFDDLVADAFKMVGKHHIKAEYRDEFVIQKEGLSGILYQLEGPVATPVQFYLTDSTQHFLRAALYFNNEVAPDSMAPVHAFVKEDVLRMIDSFEWE